MSEHKRAQKPLSPWSSRGHRWWRLPVGPSARGWRRARPHWLGLNPELLSDTCQSFCPMPLPRHQLPDWKRQRWWERRRKEEEGKKTLRVRAPVPSLQQWECFPGRRLHWERETAQFTDRNSAIHHIICSWDPQGSEGRRRGAWWQMLQYVASTKQFS